MAKYSPMPMIHFICCHSGSTPFLMAALIDLVHHLYFCLMYLSFELPVQSNFIRGWKLKHHLNRCFLLCTSLKPQLGVCSKVPYSKIRSSAPPVPDDGVPRKQDLGPSHEGCQAYLHFMVEYCLKEQPITNSFIGLLIKH